MKFDSIHACTDITGFGLLGHTDEMAGGSEKTIRLFSEQVPLLNGARELAEMGIIPSGAYRNLDYVKPRLHIAPSAKQALVDHIADPQTSGGLMVALPREDAERLVEQLREVAPCSCIMGEVLDQKEYTVEIV